MTWNSTSRSIVSSRKAVRVISFSGSSSKGYPAHQYQDCLKIRSSYLALKQISNLLLNTLCFSKQAFLDCQSLETTFAATYVVNFG
jgi:hypothetical protein